jgi:hypothetical protein
VSREVKPVGKPDAGNLHVRFDERGRETGCCHKAQATAPVLDSTVGQVKGVSGPGPAPREPAKPLKTCAPLWSRLAPLTSKNAQRDMPHRTARMHAVDPAPGQVGERGQVRLLGQHLGLEAAHLARGGRILRHSPATDDPAQGRIMRQPLGIVHVFVASEPPEDRQTGEPGRSAYDGYSDPSWYPGGLLRPGSLGREHHQGHERRADRRRT